MRYDLKTFESKIAAKLGPIQDAAWACAWLEACGYPGLKLLVEALGDPVQHLPLTRDALVALLDKIGPSILLTHSQAGAFTWPVADMRPGLV